MRVERGTKLEPKRIECIFVGYSGTSKAYCFYEPMFNKIIEICDAMFCKNYEEIELIPMEENNEKASERESEEEMKIRETSTRKSSRIRRDPIRFDIYNLFIENIEN